MMKRIMIGLERVYDLARTPGKEHAHSSRAGCELVKVDTVRATWRVPMPDGTECFMCAKSGGLNEEKFVVHVDANAFYRTWLASAPAFPQQNSSDCVPRSRMPLDSKFKDAVEGFADSADSPVPLAEVRASSEGSKGKVRIGFTNGITRTYWLLANRAPAFPVEVLGRDAAELLHRSCGIGPAPTSFTTLFGVPHQPKPLAPQPAPAKASPADPMRTRERLKTNEHGPEQGGRRRGRSR
ncbi:plasmid fertility inhibition factor family protein [Burkholderia cenocepacia]|uniref:plasmid fertility inhibition factor family protein n=1 Tax=Burkholderia cenocepacia TaxID=95486 RepID=UPI002ABDEB77|nr:hypothetical protein [Burkholderia cenocepacia]